jgi:hypothetical protein
MKTKTEAAAALITRAGVEMTPDAAAWCDAVGLVDDDIRSDVARHASGRTDRGQLRALCGGYRSGSWSEHGSGAGLEGYVSAVCLAAGVSS